MVAVTQLQSVSKLVILTSDLPLFVMTVDTDAMSDMPTSPISTNVFSATKHVDWSTTNEPLASLLFPSHAVRLMATRKAANLDADERNVCKIESLENMVCRLNGSP